MSSQLSQAFAPILGLRRGSNRGLSLIPRGGPGPSFLAINVTEEFMDIAKRQLNRREVLAGGAGLLGGGALAALMTAPAVAADDSNGFEGAWLVHVVPDGPGPSFKVLYLVARGGSVGAVSDNPPASGSTGFGSWQRTEDNKFISTFEQFQFASNGQPTGILRVRTVASLDEATDQLIGRATLDFQPPNSTNFYPAGTTHFTGARIKPVAP